MRKVGRPHKYGDQKTRTDIRKTQNRVNQRRCRMRKKLVLELTSFSKRSDNFNIQYKKDLVQFHQGFEYDYFFTGTIDQNKLERELLRKETQKITEFVQEYEKELVYKTDKRIGIKSLRRYTERYLQFLSNKNLFENCFVVFELGKNNKYHTHILFKSNPTKSNFDITSENSWLLGSCITVPVFTQEDRINLLHYCVKEMKPTSTKITDLNKVDNWFMWGDYKNKCKLVENKKILFQEFEPIK